MMAEPEDEKLSPTYSPTVVHEPSHPSNLKLEGSSTLGAIDTSTPPAGGLSIVESPVQNTRQRIKNRGADSDSRSAQARRAHTFPHDQRSPPIPSASLTFKGLMEPKKKLRPNPTLVQCLRNILLSSYLNVLLVLIPVSWAVHYSKQSDLLIFVFSFLSIIPLAALLGFATEELAMRLGAVLAGLLNVTFGNAVELIIAIVALTQNQLRIVQASMLGSILSNLLLVLGMCFFAGGLRFHEQSYGTRIAQQQIAMLSLSVFSIVIPAAFAQSVTTSPDHSDVLKISRGTAVILLICYAAFLIFQLWTHAYLYTAEASKSNADAAYKDAEQGVTPAIPAQRVFNVASMFRRGDGSVSSKDEEEEEEEEPQLTVVVALILLVVVTVFTGLTADFLVGSIDGLTKKTHINEEFVALILLPLVGNAAEHVTAVTVSVKNKLDLAMSVAIGSSIQISLFVIPFLVVLAWGLDKPLSLNFDIFETVVAFVAVVAVNYAIADGRTNWLEGFVLMILYVIIALSVFFYQVV